MFSSCSEAVWEILRSCLFTVSYSLVSLPTISADIKAVWEPPILSEWDTFSFRVALINKFPSVVFRSDWAFLSGTEQPYTFSGPPGCLWLLLPNLHVHYRLQMACVTSPADFTFWPFFREDWRYGCSSKSFVLCTECRIQLPFPSLLCRESSITSTTEVWLHVLLQLHDASSWQAYYYYLKKYLEQYQVSERLLLLASFLSEVIEERSVIENLLLSSHFSLLLYPNPLLPDDFIWFYMHSGCVGKHFSGSECLPVGGL